MNAQIDELVLSVPGLAARDARELTSRVLRKIERGLPADFQPVSLGQLNVKLSLPAGLGLEDLADRLSRAVLEQLRAGGKS